MNNKLKMAVAAITLVFAGAGLASTNSESTQPHDTWVKKLHLTSAQEQQIKTLRSNTEKELSSINVDNVQQDVIIDIIKSGKWDEQAVKKQLEEIGKIQAQARYYRVEFVFKVSQILTPEQKKQLQEMLKQQDIY